MEAVRLVASKVTLDSSGRQIGKERDKERSRKKCTR